MNTRIAAAQQRIAEVQRELELAQQEERAANIVPWPVAVGDWFLFVMDGNIVPDYPPAQATEVQHGGYMTGGRGRYPQGYQKWIQPIPKRPTDLGSKYELIGCDNKPLGPGEGFIETDDKGSVYGIATYWPPAGRNRFGAYRWKVKRLKSLRPFTFEELCQRLGTEVCSGSVHYKFMLDGKNTLASLIGLRDLDYPYTIHSWLSAKAAMEVLRFPDGSPFGVTE